MIRIHDETGTDVDAREALLDEAFGDARFAKTCERLRERRLPADGLSLVAKNDGRVVGTLRFWHVTAGPGRRALLLGPLAVAHSHGGRGIGTTLMRVGLAKAAGLGHAAVLLVGDAPYYGRFGFSAQAVAGLWLPGPYERQRFQGLELVPGALAGANGLVQATGQEIMPADIWEQVKELVARDQAIERRAA
jgi:predicted N-acetyltransferase YhbS